MNLANGNGQRPHGPGFPLWIASLLLIFAWLVPDAWTGGPVFTWERLRAAGALDSAALVAQPACGAMIMVALLLPIAGRARAIAVLVLGAGAALLPLAGSPIGIPVQSWIALGTASVLTAAAAFAFVRGRSLIAHGILLVLPVALLAMFTAVAIGGGPTGLLSGIKAPLALYAGTLACAVSLGWLLKR